MDRRTKKAKKFIQARSAGKLMIFGHLADCQRVKDMHHRVSPCTCGRAEVDEGYGR